jgi:predicted nicotinamide N-methyase
MSGASPKESEDDVPLVGDLFVCRDYETKEYRFHDLVVSLDSLQAAATDFDLTGQVLWTAAYLASWYAACPAVRERWVGADAIELGSGAGLMGMVAAQYCNSMVFTDNEKEILDLLELNLKHVPSTCKAVVAALHWGDDDNHAALDILTQRRSQGKYKLVIGCDIVYWAVSIKPLFETVTRLLAKPDPSIPGDEGGTFILGYYRRNATMQENMLQEAVDRGLEYKEIPHSTFLPDPPPEMMAPFLDKAFMYEFKWK